MKLSVPLKVEVGSGNDWLEHTNDDTKRRLRGNGNWRPLR